MACILVLRMGTLPELAIVGQVVDGNPMDLFWHQKQTMSIVVCNLKQKNHLGRMKKRPFHQQLRQSIPYYDLVCLNHLYVSQYVEAV